MKSSTLFVITISRQTGSGGAFIGQQLSQKMDIFYADREIIRKAAQQLSVLEKDLESREEKILSFWETFLQISAFASNTYLPPKMSAPTDFELFVTESKIIRQIAKKQPAVIIGRCGFHVLREQQKHVSIFLHGDIADRISRIQKLHNISEDEAKKLILKSDKERAFYCKTFTEKEWIDARNYDLSINTSRTGIDKTAEVIMDYLKFR